VGCGDLPFDYLEYLVSRTNVPLYYVPGNHDPSLKEPDTTWTPLRAVVELPPPGPEGCINIDGHVVGFRGLRIAGLGGSLRYKEGPNQYTQAQMGRRALKLEFRLRLNRVHNGRKLDVLVTHAPPFGLAQAEDSAHVGFVAFLRLIRNFRPLLAVHGHIHPYGRVLPERKVGPTRVVNAIPFRLIDL
jgi:Icc-related predicted phosphoesterase